MEATEYRNRVKELRFVRAGDLKAHALNPRVHPPGQVSALRVSLERIGYADALIAYTEPDGTLRLIDGHARRDLTPDTEVPVIVTDLSEEEAALMVAIGDPLAALAETDFRVMAELLLQANEGDVSLLMEASPDLAALLGREEVPDFGPVGEDEQGRLDERAKVTCPECGHEFTP